MVKRRSLPVLRMVQPILSICTFTYRRTNKAKHDMRPLYYLTTLIALLPFAQALALESATTGSQATQATVGAINSKVDTSIAALQAQIGGIVYCNSVRKFYAPGDAKKDTNGCVGVGDYPLAMASPNTITTINGGIDVTGAPALHLTNNGNGNWTQSIDAGAGPYGLKITGANSFYGLYIDTPAHNGLLCVNNLCSRRGFGGTFTWNNNGYCYRANPETGGCSCPSGFGAYYGTGGFSNLDLYICE
jgi:hypothetical protein